MTEPASIDRRRLGVIILGAPRSGTTLLRRLFDAHPSFACPGETNLFSACARFLKRERIAEGAEIGVERGLSLAGFEPTETRSRLRDLAFGFHVEHAARVGKPRWVEKTAFDAFHVDDIDRLVGGHVRYVIITRHGLDCAVSMDELCRKNGVYLSELHDYIRRYPKPLEAFARAWVDLSSSLTKLEERRGEDCIRLRYEDLIAAPERELDRVFSDLGEVLPDGLVAGALSSKQNVGLGDWKTYGRTEIDSDSQGRWQKLSRRTQAELAPIVNETLEALGYARLETPVVDDDESVAARRYALGLMVSGLKKG